MLATPTPTLPIYRTVLDNGIVVLTAENHAADIIAARIFVRAGGRYETGHQAGISHLMTALMTKGTERLSSMEIAEQVESVGASLGTDSTPDYCLLSLKTVSHDFPEMLHLAAELLRSPTFPEAELELERKLTLQGIRSTLEQPFAIAQKQLRQSMYADHPYALSALGTEESVVRLSRDQLQQYHQTYFRPDNLVVSITGRITPTEAIALVQETLGSWPVPQACLPDLKLPEVAAQPQTLATVQDTQQAIVMLGFLTPAVHHPDYMPLKLLSTYLGNGLSSRLFVELREKRGLAYEVSAYYPTRLDASQFVAYMGTAPGNVAIALDGLQSEVQRLSSILLDPDELQATKNKLLGQYALGKQTNAQIAQIFGWYEILGLGIDFDQRFQAAVEAVTAEAAQSAAQRYFALEPYISLVGPAFAVKD